jgi:hypothetical protein
VPDAGASNLACAERLEVPTRSPTDAGDPVVDQAAHAAVHAKWLARRQVFSRLTLAELLKGPDDELESEIYDRLTERFFDDLSADEQRYAAVVEFEGQVNNGGFDQYFFNNSGNHALRAREGLALYEEAQPDGGRPGLTLMDCAFAAFPNHRPSTNAFAREDQLTAVGPAAKRHFAHLDKVFYGTRIDYGAARRVRAHPELFPNLAQPLPPRTVP